MKNATILAALLAVVVLSAAAPAADSPRRPNVLWLIAEDLGPELGCYGTSQVWTPNLDRLAAAGMRFTRAYTTAPVCSPSRSAMMTGMYQTTIGAHHHRSHRGDGFALPAGVRVAPALFRDAGYFTANVVKLPAELAFKGTGKTDWNFAVAPPVFDSNAWDDLRAHQPFYAQLNFNETHRAFRAPRKADPEKVAIPPYYPDHPVTRRDWAAYLDSASELDRKVGLVLERLAAEDLLESTVVFFFGDNGQAHVRGKQFCYEEGLHVPLIVRWPGRFPAPALYAAGTVSDRFVEAIDFLPTCLAVAGVAKPAGMQGRVLFGDGADPPREFAFGARDRCDETVFRLRTVRDARYRYIRNYTPDRPFLQANAYKERQYPVWNLLKELHAAGALTPPQAALCRPTLPAEELYDVAADPHEIQNLAASEAAEHRAALERLRRALDRWIEETGDQGRVPEAAQEARDRPARRPNILFFLVDDLGFMDIGANNPATFYETPNVDRLAARGVRFTAGYAACPVCSPTRASILTGNYPCRTGITDWINQAGGNQPEQWKRPTKLLPAPYRDRLALEETTLAEALAEAGYATFFAGKWHLGPEGFWPEDQGFAINKGGCERGGPYGGDKYFSPYGNPRLSDGPPGEHLPDRLAAETAAFMEANRDRPFLAYLSFYSVHTPLMARADLKQKYEEKRKKLASSGPLFGQEGKNQVRLVQEHAVYAGMVEAMDQAVGKVLAALDRLGLADTTAVFFMSDNGGLATSEGHPTSNLPLRAGKGWLYEGGIREPWLVAWPGVTRPGSVCETPVTSTDFYPTILEIAGLPPRARQHVDGVSLVPLLRGGALERGPLFWHYPHYSNQGGAPAGAIRDGAWKLIEWFEDGRVELYDLGADVGERSDRAAAMPEQAQALREKLAAWRRDAGAVMPRPRGGDG